MGVQSIGMPVRREEDFRLLRGRAAMSTTSRRRPTSVGSGAGICSSRSPWFWFASLSRADGNRSFWSFPCYCNQTVHVLAAGLWLGGLAPLRWLLRRARARRLGSSVACSVSS